MFFLGGSKRLFDFFWPERLHDLFFDPRGYVIFLLLTERLHDFLLGPEGGVIIFLAREVP